MELFHIWTQRANPPNWSHPWPIRRTKSEPVQGRHAELAGILALSRPKIKIIEH